MTITRNNKLCLILIGLILLAGIANGATLTVNATSTNQDGRISRQPVGEAFSVIRAGAGTNIQNTTTDISIVGIGAAENATPVWDSNIRFAWTGNTSALPDDCTINSATFSVRGFAGSSNGVGNISVGLVGFTPGITGMITENDYNTRGTTRLASTDITYATWSSTGYNTFTLNAAGLSAISKTGYTNLMLATHWDIDNSVTGLAWSYGTSSVIKGYDTSKGAGYVPTLVIDYTPASVPGPSIEATFTPTNTTNQTVFGWASTTFISTSTGPLTGYSWSYKNVTPGNNTEIVFNTSSSTPLKRFGIGNYSIRLNATNATAFNKTEDYLHWVNVSQWNQDGTDFLPLLPSDHVFRMNISNSTLFPVNSTSSTWTAAIDSHATAGHITFNIYKPNLNSYVGTDVPMETIHITGYYSYSDHVMPYPVAEDMDVETLSSDQAINILIRGTNLVYEYEGAEFGTGSESAILHTTFANAFNLTNYSVHHPLGTGATLVSGVPKIPLLVTKADIASGSIDHALLLSLGYNRGTSASDYVWPASAAATGATALDAHFPPMGMRFRLKSSFDTSGYSTNQTMVLNALKNYGGIFTVINNKETITVVGEEDADATGTWTSMVGIQATDFEIIDEQTYMVSSSSYITRGIPLSDFYATPVSGASPLSVSFVDTTLHTPTNWDWYWYANETKSSDSQHPSTTLTTGTYNVRLYTSNSYGGNWMNKTAYVTVTTTVCAPVANFTGTPLIGDAPLTVSFTDTSTCYPTAWYWVYGGGTLISYEQNPNYTFTLPGLYGIGLSAYNDEGWDSEYKGSYINVTAPASDPIVPDFGGVPVDGGEPLTVQFTDASTGPIIAWLWNFGDGVTSTLQDPPHVYSTQGDYTVSLTIFNTTDSEVKTRTDYITVFHVPTVVPTTVIPTPVITPSGSGPQIEGYSSLTSNGVNVSVTTSSIYGTDVWLIYGQNRGGYTWITQNFTKSSTATTTVILQGSPLFGNTAYWTRACDGSGLCGNEIPFSTAQITPMPTSNFGQGFKNIVGMR